MKRFKYILTLVLCASMALSLSAQSDSFKAGKNLNVQFSILKELQRSYVDTVQMDELVLDGINAMLSKLDPYTIYVPEENEEDMELLMNGTYGGIGAVVQKKVDGPVVITEPYKDSPASKFGLVPGDQIIEIDNKSVIGETSAESTSRMKGVPGSNVLFKVVKMRSGDTVLVDVVRERIRVSSLDYAGIIRDSIGYITLSGFITGTAKEVRNAFLDLKKDGAKKIVLDLRDNGGGSLAEAVEIVSLFVPKGTLVISSKGKIEGSNKEYYTTSHPVDTLVPIMVMINSGSASASEIVAGAIQDLDRGFVAGKRSFGKGLVQSVVPMPFDGTLKYTTAKYYTPSGRCVQAIDYSHRNEDGSVGNIPDSLTSEFTTKKGRIVKDGGGITPDIEIDNIVYGRVSFSVVFNNIVSDYAMDYYKKHPKIAPAEEFVLTDEGYDDFVKFAASREFDARSVSQVEMDDLLKKAKEEGMYEIFKAEFDALSDKLNLSKEEALKMAKDELLPIIEAEILSKYYFREASIFPELRYDKQLEEALDSWKSNFPL